SGERCSAWVASALYEPEPSTCSGDIRRALDQIGFDAPGSLDLSSGRRALVWFPDDWADRTQRTVLTLLHGSAGCPEAMFADARWAFGDAHALVSLGHKLPSGGFLDELSIHADLNETLTALSAPCPTADATHLLYGLSRGGYRAIQLGGLDQEGDARFAAVVSDSGSVPTSVLSGPSYRGARVLLWCGEYDPDPVQDGRTTCDVMGSDMVPYLERGGASAELIVGERACHGMYGWDCAADCSQCAGRTGHREVGPHASAVAAWLQDQAQ
ncbi:MAG TPA: hypothetical protein DFR83_05470, partial [Deltaproteobacteria bacterium]|nr:hypothetical protein [Deltaproteobacteria bacterium]